MILETQKTAPAQKKLIDAYSIMAIEEYTEAETLI